MHYISAPSLVLSVLGSVCFAAFCWGVKGHFRRTGAVPAGTIFISVLTVGFYAWFALRAAINTPSPAWPASSALFAAAFGLFAWTVFATRHTPPTLAFDTDEPAFLLRHGPYRYVRHPFYLSYLLFWTGTAAASCGFAPWLAPLVMLAVYRVAAGREEQKFAGSDFRGAYDAYRLEAGMFFPRARSLAA